MGAVAPADDAYIVASLLASCGIAALVSWRAHALFAWLASVRRA
jgi:hypothetical protein